ncbi:MAG: hypothetical protein AAGF49_06640 [Pseudomonadota bacterium]
MTNFYFESDNSNSFDFNGGQEGEPYGDLFGSDGSDTLIFNDGTYVSHDDGNSVNVEEEIFENYYDVFPMDLAPTEWAPGQEPKDPTATDPEEPVDGGTTKEKEPFQPWTTEDDGLFLM